MTATVAARPGTRALDWMLPRPEHGRRIPGIEGIRGLGCMAVAVGHVVEMNAFGTATNMKLWVLGSALVLFFAASGFLLYLQFLVRFLSGAPRPDFVRYTSRRFFRIFPGYVVIFLLANFVLQSVYVQNQLLAKQEQIETGVPLVGVGMITDPGMFLTNLTLTQTYLPAYIQTGVNPSWSLTLELAFYFTLPLFALLIWWLRDNTRWNPIAIAIVPPAILVAVSTVSKFVADRLSAAHGGIGDPENAFGPTWLAVLTRSILVLGDNFGVGMLAAVVYAALFLGKMPRLRLMPLRIGMLALIVACVPLWLMTRSAATRFDTSVIAIMCFAVLIFVTVPHARGVASPFADFCDNRFFYRLGTISMSVYLWHYPVLLLMRRWGWYGDDTVTGMLLSLLPVLVICLVLSEITYRLVEAPGMRLQFRKNDSGQWRIVG